MAKLPFQYILDDMQRNPETYYRQMGNSITKFKSELQHIGYMADLDKFSLPEKYTHYAKVYEDMRSDPDDYISKLGQSGYKQELENIGELYRLERDNTTQIISYVDGRVKNDFLKQTGLDSVYKYDLTNPEDLILAELGYAPASFDYSVQDIIAKADEGFSWSELRDHYDRRTGNQYYRDISYLEQKYSYDTEDPDDMLNKALGLAPKSFKYSNSIEDQIRKENGQLPEEAEEYIGERTQFDFEYTDYARKMQNYKDALFAWENLPKSSQLVTEKPTDPYKDEEIPVSVQAYIQWINQGLIDSEKGLSTEAQIQSFLEDNTTKKDETVFGYYSDLAVLPEDFKVSENYQEVYDRYNKLVGNKSYDEIMQLAKENGALKATTGIDEAKGAIADMVFQDMYTEHLKETGEYDILVDKQEQRNADILSAMEGKYSPESFALLSQNLNPVDFGIESFQDIAVQALYWSKENPDIFEEGTELSDKAIYGMKDVFGRKAASDPVIQNIQNQLEDLGWSTNQYYKVKNVTPEVQELLDQASFRMMQLQTDAFKDYQGALEKMPSWYIGLSEGMYVGGGAPFRNFDSVNKHILQFFSYGTDGEEVIKQQINDLAQSDTAKRQLGSLNTSLGNNASNATQFLYEAAMTGTEMGIELAMAAGIGGSAGAASAGTKATSVWRNIGRRLIMNKNMTPFFVSSLGRNLMQGEIEGRTTAEKWLQAIPAAYVESVIEQQFGLFSNKSPLSTLIRNGAKGATKVTALNTARMVAGQFVGTALGEAFEEVTQDFTTEIFRDIMYKDYKGQYGAITEQIPKTALMAATMGIFFSIIGLPASIANAKITQGAQVSYNNMVEAFDSGDIKTMNIEAQRLKDYYQIATGEMFAAMDDGSLESLMKASQKASAIEVNLNEANEAMKQALFAEQAFNAGQLTKEQVAVKRASANEAINRIGSNINESSAKPRTLYEQVANNKELTQILTQGGFAAELIRSTDGVMSNNQVEVVKNADAAAKENPYLNTVFEENTTEETLTRKIQKAKEDVSLQKAQRAALDSIKKEKLEAAYAVSKQNGKAVFAEIESLQNSYEKKIVAAEGKLSDAQSQLDAFKTQAEIYTKFAGPQNNTAVAADGVQATQIQGVNVQTQAQAEQGAQSATEGLLDLVTPINETQETHNKMYQNYIVTTSPEIRTSTLTQMVDEFFEAANGLDENVAQEQKNALLKNVQKKYAQIIELEAKLNEDPVNEKLEAKRDTAVRQLFDMVDVKKLSRKVSELTANIEASMKYITDKFTAYNWLDFAHNEGDYGAMFRVFNQALDVITNRTAALAEASNFADNAKITMYNNVPMNKKNISRRAQIKAQRGEDIKDFDSPGYALFGLGAQSIDQVALDLTGNIDSDGIYNLFYKNGSDSFNSMAWLKTNDDTYIASYLDQFQSTLGKNYKKFTTNYVGQYKLSNGQTIDLTLNDIVAIHNNVKAGNNLTDGVRLSNKQEISKANANEKVWSEISSILDDEAIGNQAKAIQDKIDSLDLQNIKEIADFFYDFVNADTYVNDKGETILAPKGRMDYGEFAVTGLKRSAGEYWMRTKVAQGQDINLAKKSETSTGNIKIEKVRTEDSGVVQLPNVIKQMDAHAYQTARIMAYKPYQQKLIDAMYTQTNEQSSLETMRETFGDAYVERVKFYMESLNKTPDSKEAMKRFWNAIYKKARTVRLASISVYFKQLASIEHARAYLDTKYQPLIKSYKAFKLSAEQQENIRKNAASAVMRRAGYSLRETAEASGSQAFLDKIMKPVTWFDTRAINYIYQWTENQVKAENPTLKGEKLNRAIAQEFRSVVEKTQPTFAPHTASQIAQSNHFMTKLFTMYSTATNSMYNTFVGGIRDIKTGQAKRGARKLLSVFMSNAVAWSIGTGLSALIKGTDWEDENTWYKAMDIASAFTGQFYGIRTVTSALKFKNMSIPIVDEFADIITKSFDDNGFLGHSSKWFEARSEEDEEAMHKYSKKMLGDIKTISFAFANLFGVPVKSFEGWIVKPMSRLWGEQGVNDYNAAWGYNTDASSNYEDLRKAIDKGNTNDIEQLIPVIINKGGKIENFLKAKTGGKDLNPAKANELINTWKKIQYEMELEEMQSGK